MATSPENSKAQLFTDKNKGLILNTEKLATHYEENSITLWIALSVVCLGTFFATTTVSAVNMAIPDIATELKASAVKAGWLPTLFTLTCTIFILPFGRVADSYGIKKVYVLGLAVFSLSSLIAAKVNSIEQLLAIRTIQGIGTGQIFATGMALVVSIAPPEKRGTAIGTASAFIYAGFACGPLIGGWLTEYYGWRSVFAFQVPFTLLAIFLILWKVDGEWKNDLKEPFDWLGSLLFIAWATAVFIGVSEVPSPRAFFLLAVGALLLVGFVRHQLRTEYPLIKLKELKDNKIFVTSLISSLIMYAGNYPLIFLLSLYLQYVRGFSAGNAGELLVILALLVALAGPIAGRLSDSYKPKIIATLGCLISTVGFALLFGVTNQSTLFFTVIGLIVYGFGFGFFSTPNNNAAISSVSKEGVGVASAMMNLLKSMGNMLGGMVVMLLVSMNMGGQAIQPDNYPALTRIVIWCMSLGFCYGIFSAILCHKQHPQEESQ
jgi:EmrB/QacA subfamily drug resistance transporter